MKIRYHFLVSLILCNLHTSEGVTGGRFGIYVDICPRLCNEAGPDPSQWTTYHSLEVLIDCMGTLLFDINVPYSDKDSNAETVLRVCVSGGAEDYSSSASITPQYKETNTTTNGTVLDTAPNSSECNTRIEKVGIMSRWGSSASIIPATVPDISAAAKHLAHYFKSTPSCGQRLLFAKSGGAIVGSYAGFGLQQSAGADLLDIFAKHTDPSNQVFQLCTPRSSESWIFGAFGGGIPDLAKIQEASGGEIEIGVHSSFSGASSINVNATGFNWNSTRTLIAVPTVSPGPDGTCFTYQVLAGEGCWAIANKNGIKQGDITNNNQNTWGWAGCSKLKPGQLLCLSPGDPPMPAQSAGLVCGPQVQGTQKPTNGTKLEDLNLCPLNACCSIWGYCGTTDDFCTKHLADTGAPGTSTQQNGCAGSCGMDIVNNKNQPSSFSRVGYFTAWNQDRRCLNMDVTQINQNNFTHIHFSFATLTPNFQVNITGMEDQFAKFVQMKGIKKIMSFGGWAFSTEPATYMIFRQATAPANVEATAHNVVSFLNKYGLDGLDFDWEYPGVPDIPGIPPGGAEEGQNYLNFLKSVRSKMPAISSLSIALPASFWYLRAFPVNDMQKYVDYFIYMTYDLHGQWDYGNKNAIPGCPGGNCLRSHVNKTETSNVLSMITKAGVSASKIMVGVSSYGRSFRMSDWKCDGPMCTYTGSRAHSDAYPGLCTETAGYIADAEIRDNIENPANYTIFTNYVDVESDSNILVYGDAAAADWVAWMDRDVKARRTDWIKSLNFAGTTDWAIDLEDWQGSVGGGNDTEFVMPDLACHPSQNPGNLEGLAAALDSVPSHCTAQFTMEILSESMENFSSDYADAAAGYDDKFGYYVDWVKDSISPRLKDYMDLDKGPGNKYFICHWEAGNKKGTDQCPPPNKFWQLDQRYDITYELNDANGFYDAISKDLGMPKDWVKFGDVNDGYTCALNPESRPGGGSQPCQKLQHLRHSFPQKSDKVDVPNPKDIIQKVMPNITDLQIGILAVSTDLGMSVLQGDEKDAVTGVSMPILMLQEAVASMKNIKDIGQKVHDEKKKQLILMILSIVLMVLPFAGEALGAAFGGAVAVSRIALVIDQAGNAALTIEDIVSDPESAPFAIIGLLAGIGGGGKVAKLDEDILTEASAARRGLKDSDLAKFPQSFRRNDDLVQKILKTCGKT
ncbi:glycoside hydrolase [Microthyrium microscopicum]|uniref:chitinase n=1 Tax=Microthyrium microscopicum TaxID=703497 RepID=A0A6A6TYP6_9PEZI|nr:glycoside hydrolase [Microthyrium microscopicum]